MTAAELVRYNLARLVLTCGRPPADLAIIAWPMPERLSAKMWAADVATRRQRLARYSNGEVRPTLEALDDLARALGCKVAEFFREPAQ
jgi:transcriptional regulator with XRE-family HTH domain